MLQEILPGFVDIWPKVRSDEGFTFDGVTNPICIEDPKEQMRYDRMIVRAGEGLFEPVAAELLGTREINSWGLKLSDHYGLQGDFVFAV